MFRPKVIRPSDHQLVIRYSKRWAWFQVAVVVLLGKHVEIEYHGVTHGHPIQSLNLTERQLEDEK